jgi:hypothetical protein
MPAGEPAGMFKPDPDSCLAGHCAGTGHVVGTGHIIGGHIIGRFS